MQSMPPSGLAVQNMFIPVPVISISEKYDGVAGCAPDSATDTGKYWKVPCAQSGVQSFTKY